jgi:hypothetical protein
VRGRVSEKLHQIGWGSGLCIPIVKTPLVSVTLVKTLFYSIY